MEFFQYALKVVISEKLYGIVFYDWVKYAVGGLLFALVYVFRSLGLFTIAKREGYAHKWMAFVPFLSTYYIGVCGQKNRFFRIDTRKIAIVAAALEGVFVALSIMYFVAVDYFLQPYISIEKSTVEYAGETFDLMQRTLDPTLVPANLNWAVWCYNSLYDYFLSWLEIVYLLVMVVVLNCFFQTYSAKRYFLFTLSSVLFPLQGILIFAVRKNSSMSYADYTRRVQEKMYRMYRDQQQSFDQNPYENNPYSTDFENQSPYEGRAHDERPKEPEDPFAEFKSNSDSDPFEGF